MDFRSGFLEGETIDRGDVPARGVGQEDHGDARVDQAIQRGQQMLVDVIPQDLFAVAVPAVGAVERLLHPRGTAVDAGDMLLGAAQQPVDGVHDDGSVFVVPGGERLDPRLDGGPVGQVGRAITTHMRAAILAVDDDRLVRSGAEGGLSDARWAVDDALGRAQLGFGQYGKWQSHVRDLQISADYR